MMDQLKQYWATREPREQMMLGACMALIVVALLYALWAPLAREQQRLQRRLPQLQQEAQHMQQMADQWSASGSAKASQQDWRAASQARLVTFRLPSQQAKLLSSDAEVQRWQFDNVPFNSFLDWLTSLYNDVGVRVKTIKLTPTGPGAVNIMLELYHP